jgi:hypothetical protein
LLWSLLITGYALGPVVKLSVSKAENETGGEKVPENTGPMIADCGIRIDKAGSRLF